MGHVAEMGRREVYCKEIGLYSSISDNCRCQFRQTESGGIRFCQNGHVLAAYMTSHPKRHSSSNINIARCEYHVEAYQQEFVAM